MYLVNEVTSQKKYRQGLFQEGAGKRAFIATPMNGLGSEALYKENRKAILRLSGHLQTNHGFSSVYFAGQNIESKANFSSGSAALTADLSAIRDADIFILVYPVKVLSSVLVEAGYAMALGKPLLLLVRKQEDLPYLLSEAEKLKGADMFPNILIRVYNGYEDLQRSFDESVPQLID